MRFRPFLLAILIGCGGSASDASAQAMERCTSAERFLTEQMGFVARTAADSVDDWRTRQVHAGCRVTGARTTRIALKDEAQIFYNRLREAGWTRTPDPRDAPNESSLRFRLGPTDCLFNIYQGPLVMSPAEIEVNTAVVPEPGELRYNVLAQCIAAMDAAPRSAPEP